MSTAPATDRSGVLATIQETPPAVKHLLAGVMVNQLGAFVQPYLVLYLTHRGFSIGQAGLALTAYSIGAVGGTMAGGEFTHRLGPRTTIIAAMTSSAIVLALIPSLSTAGLSPMSVSAIALAGFVGQSYRPAAAVMLSDLMPDRHRVLAFSMMRIALNAGAGLAPLIAGVLILVDWNLLFFFDALTALLCALLAWRTLPEIRVVADEKSEIPGQSGYSVLLRDRRYHLFLASAFLGALIWVQYLVTMPLNLAAEGYPTGLYSAALTTGSLILVVFELKVTTYVEQWRANVACAFGTAVMGLGLAGYALARYGVAPIFITTAVIVAGMMMMGPTMFAYPATFPAAAKSRYVATHQTVFGLGQALGPTLGVIVWGAIGAGIWPLCGLLGLLAAWCAHMGIRAGEQRGG